MILANRHPDLKHVKGIAFRNGNDVVTTEPRSPIKELDSVPLPAYHLVDVSSYGQVGILTSRGCPYSCSFCSTSPLWGKQVRHRSAGSVIREMESLIDLGWGSKDKPISFLDDLFTDSAHYVHSVCGEIRDRQLNAAWHCLARVNTLTDQVLTSMTSAGCKGLSIGIESGSDRVLSAMRKGLTSKEALAASTRVYSHVEDAKFWFMWGFPFEYPIDLVETTMLIREMLSRLKGRQNCIIGINLAAPLPGSELFQQHCDDIFIDFDLYFNYAGLASKSFLGNEQLRHQLLEVIQEMPGLFSAYYCFNQPAIDLKRQLLDNLHLLKPRQHFETGR